MITLKAPSKIVADNSLNFFYHFLEKIRPDISCELLQTIHMKYQVLFSLKTNNKKKIRYFKILSAAVAIGAFRVKSITGADHLN